jgi:ribosome-binding factor A
LPNYNKSYYKNRLETNLLRYLASFINEIVSDPLIGLITITEIKLSSDSDDAVVFFMILPTELEIINLTKKLLNSSLPLIKKELATRMTNIRKLPILEFKYDDALAYGNKIESILNKINKK